MEGGERAALSLALRVCGAGRLLARLIVNDAIVVEAENGNNTLSKSERRVL